MSRLVAVAGSLLAAILTTGAPPDGGERSPDELVREVAARSEWWLSPAPQLETLEYDFVSGADVTPVRAVKGDRRRYSVWMGATLHAGFRDLMRSPERYEVTAEPAADGKTITLRAKLKVEGDNVGVEAGNGVDGSWRGYYSHGARETTIVIDAERLVPLEERTGLTTVRYSGWKEVAAGKWVPAQVDVLGPQIHWRMRFAWLGDAVWLLTSSESIREEGDTVMARTRNVRVNGEAVAAVESEADRASREAAKAVVAMLDANRPWLDGGETGAGWKPPFETLSYVFHTVREDVRESCVLGRDGPAVFEVTHDGQGKMKDALGRRKISLNTGEYAVADDDGTLARIFGRPTKERDQPTDLALKHYARIGCQFDLPLFRYRERINAATVAVADGEWEGTPCRVATVSNLGGDVPLGCGTMLAFTSWSYVHHIAPAKEVIYIDAVRNVPIHETLTSARDGKVFEIDFDDYVEVEPEQWAPLSIRVEAKDYFTCEYRFRLVAGRHWLLEEVVSWFKPEEKSRGVVENLQIDAGRETLDESLRQVEATRSLLSGKGGPDTRVDVATVPFVVGRATTAGPYEFTVSLANKWMVLVTASTTDPDAPAVVPLGFLDERSRLLFAPSVRLTEGADGVRRGSVEVRGSQSWADVRSVAVPTSGPSTSSVLVVPYRSGEVVEINVPDAWEGKLFGYGRDEKPREAKTRAFRARVDEATNGVKLTLDVVSFDGPQEFYLDLSAAVLAGDGRLVATGHQSETFRVESDPVERNVEIDFDPIPADAEPAFLTIGVAPGDQLSAPMGSLWGRGFMEGVPFEIADLLAAADDDCRRFGLGKLGDRNASESIEKEFFDDREDERRIGDGPYSRRTLITPHVDALVRILRESKADGVRASAARFLAYSEADGAAGHLEPLAADGSRQVREAAVVGLTFLGAPADLDTLRAMLKRTPPPSPAEDESRRAEWRAFRATEQDVLIALTRQGSDAAVDLLGETLIADLDAAHPVSDAQGRARLEGPTERAGRVVTLLGRTGNPRSVTRLAAAFDLVSHRPDLAELFGVAEIVHAMVRFKEHAKDRITAALESGPNPAVWAYAVREARDPVFVPAVRAMLRREDLTRDGLESATSYLWNVGTPEAVEGLREAYDRGRFKVPDRTWLQLCEALAAHGDGRGLIDAYEVLVDLEGPSEPTAYEKERRSWERERERRRKEADDVFARAPNEGVVAFLAERSGATSPEERRVVLARLWQVADIPPAYEAILPRWAEDRDAEVARSATRLRDRDSGRSR